MLKRVTASLKQFGLVFPLLIDRQQRIVAGHVVLEAAKRLGCKTVPCIQLDHLSDGQARLLRISLNRLAETGEWDLDELRIELRELQVVIPDLTVTGFELPELDLMLSAPAGEEAEEEQVLDVQAVAVSVPGDLWLLREHRLLCGDSLSETSYARVLDGVTPDAVFSDPPYNCKIKGNVGGLGKIKHKDFAMAVGEMSDVEFVAFLQAYLTCCSAHLVKGGVIYACIDWRQVDKLITAGAGAGLHLINMAVWNKGSGGMGGLYRSAHELVPVFCNGSSPVTNNVQLGKHGRDRTNVWTYPGANRRGSSAGKALGDHPTPKPIELVADALLDVTRRGDRVLDPFMGSGTTIIAAERTGRIAYGIELDPAYVDVAIRRWEQLTGGTARHAETGRSFAEEALHRTTPAAEAA